MRGGDAIQTPPPPMPPRQTKGRKRKRGVQIRCPVGVEQSWIVPRQLGVHQERTRETFHLFDRRHVGYFTEKDVKRVFGGSGPQYTEFLDRFDANHDGKVNDRSKKKKEEAVMHGILAHVCVQ